jgi:hypothetical protein
MEGSLYPVLPIPANAPGPSPNPPNRARYRARARHRSPLAWEAIKRGILRSQFFLSSKCLAQHRSKIEHEHDNDNEHD